MKSNIKNFVEEYNKRISWNVDIIKQLGKKNIPAEIIDDYLYVMVTSVAQRK